MSKLLDVSIIIVSYNGKEMLRDCLQSVFRNTEGIDFEVIVSDNGSSDGSIEMIQESFPSVTLIKNGDNFGFAKANNIALPYCKGRYTLLLNPDTILSNNAIMRMVKFMDENPKIGACGPKLLNADGSLQHSARNFPSISNQLAESLFLHKVFPNVIRFSELIMRSSFYKKTQTVDWVTGAALMIRREALDDVGGLDERYFMYTEEKDWCFNAWKRGWPVAFISDAKILHLHGDSGTNPKLFSLMIKSKKLYLRKNYSPVKASTIVAIMRFNLAVRLVSSMIIKLLAPSLARRASNKLEVSKAGRRNLNV